MPAFVVHEYQTAAGAAPLAEWLERLRDAQARARIVARLDRLRAGLLGDWRSVGHGVCELRIDHGPGYRVYFGKEGRALILLLCGGDKRTQAKDIERAHAYWEDYKRRGPKPSLQSSDSSAQSGRNRHVH